MKVQTGKALIAGVAALALALTACSSSGNGGTPTNNNSSSTTSGGADEHAADRHHDIGQQRHGVPAGHRCLRSLQVGPEHV